LWGPVPPGADGQAVCRPVPARVALTRSVRRLPHAPREGSGGAACQAACQRGGGVGRLPPSTQPLEEQDTCGCDPGAACQPARGSQETPATPAPRPPVSALPPRP